MGVIFASMLGSSRVVVNSSGTLLDDSDFYPFGGEKPFTSSSGNTYKFTGKERDPETGNDDFGARYYSSVYGRFLSADWSAVPAPVPYANLSNPQTLNLYAIVSDNPESFADLDGHFGSVVGGTDNGCGEMNSPCPTDNAATTPAQQPSPPPQQQDKDKDEEKAQQHTVTIEEVKGQGGNAFNHSAISVDGRQPVGFEQQKESVSAALEDKTTPGAVKPIDPKRKVEDKVEIKVTPEQAAKIQKFLDNAIHNPPNYNLYHSNCAQFSESALKAGGVKNVPGDVTPHGLVEDLKAASPP